METNDIIQNKEFRDNLEALGYGICENEHCAEILPIGRGESFEWDEEQEKWFCERCAKQTNCQICGKCKPINLNQNEIIDGVKYEWFQCKEHNDSFCVEVRE